jgi:tetratricopeptide (TPR) repeat protein
VFAPSSQSEPIDPAAYDLYLKALGEMGNLRNPATNVTIIDKLEQATTAAPRFARAWSCLATMRARRLRFGPPGQTYADLRGKVVEAAETALRLDPALGEPYQALSQLEPFGRYLEREALQRKALSLAVNDPRVLYSAAVFAAEVGRTREALDYARQAYALDPMYLQAANRYAVLLDAEGRFEESGPLWEKFSALWPQSEDIGWNVIQSSLHSADWVRFDRLVATALALGRHPGQIELLAWFAGNLRAPDPASLQVALSQTREEFARTGKVAFARLAIGYRLGLTEEMFELIEQCSFDHIFDPETPSPDGTTSNFALIFNRSLNGSMMRDPRFPSFCARLGLCDYWVATERWPDCADAGVTPYDFKAECRRLVGT